MAGDEHTIPSINVTNAANSTPSLHPEPAEAQNASLLSPVAHPPPSPAPSDYSSTSTYPPSPTISVHSGNQFKTTLALRENQPDDKSGLSSLHMLSPKDAEPSGHKRKSSNATMNSSITEADVELGDMPKVNSCATSLTDIDPHASSTPKLPESSDSSKKNKKDKMKDKMKDKKDKKDKKKDSNNDHEGQTAHQRELLQDEGLDPTPFEFKPYQLAHMLDPKSLPTLVSIGGVAGVLRGLGTSAEYGLSTKSLPRSGTVKSTASAKSRNDPPTITLTEPSGVVREPSNTEDHPAFAATFDDRRRVFGENLLPHRPSKSLLQLMWLAMKDKVLVRLRRHL